MINVTVWQEHWQDKLDDNVKEVYPEFIHNCIAEFLGKEEDFNVRTATLDMPECGLPDEVLNTTDVLFWWGHCKHDDVPDELAKKVQQRVLCGMGLIVLHSGHFSKPFRLLMGTTCSLKWREGDRERLWCIAPGHPIAKGIPEHVELEMEEMYGERFDIPQPDELVFIGWFKGGEVFRSGCCWNRGLGKVFYFQPGHEGNPTFRNPYIQKILVNATRWAAPANPIVDDIECPWSASLENA